jgi:hypothetical protein
MATTRSCGLVGNNPLPLDRRPRARMASKRR